MKSKIETKFKLFRICIGSGGSDRFACQKKRYGQQIKKKILCLIEVQAVKYSLIPYEVKWISCFVTYRKY